MKYRLGSTSPHKLRTHNLQHAVLGTFRHAPQASHGEKLHTKRVHAITDRHTQFGRSRGVSLGEYGQPSQPTSPIQRTQNIGTNMSNTSIKLHSNDMRLSINPAHNSSVSKVCVGAEKAASTVPTVKYEHHTTGGCRNTDSPCKGVSETMDQPRDGRLAQASRILNQANAKYRIKSKPSLPWNTICFSSASPHKLRAHNLQHAVLGTFRHAPPTSPALSDVKTWQNRPSPSERAATKRFGRSRGLSLGEYSDCLPFSPPLPPPLCCASPIHSTKKQSADPNPSALPSASLLAGIPFSADCVGHTPTVSTDQARHEMKASIGNGRIGKGMGDLESGCDVEVHDNSRQVRATTLVSYAADRHSTIPDIHAGSCKDQQPFGNRNGLANASPCTDATTTSTATSTTTSMTTTTSKITNASTSTRIRTDTDVSMVASVAFPIRNLHDRYTVGRQIGKGSTSVVYVAAAKPRTPVEARQADMRHRDRASRNLTSITYDVSVTEIGDRDRVNGGRCGSDFGVGKGTHSSGNGSSSSSSKVISISNGSDSFTDKDSRGSCAATTTRSTANSSGASTSVSDDTTRKGFGQVAVKCISKHGTGGTYE